MLARLISASLRQPVLVLAFATVLIVLGVRAVYTTPLDVFPEFAPPLVEIQTEAPGLSTEEVESLITVPLERAVNGTSWLITLRSKSVLGLSSVVCLFAEGTDLMQARQLVQERVATVAPRLPAAARAPVLLPPVSATSRVLKIGLSSKTLSPMELSALAAWTIRPRLMAVPGVANVAIWGQRDRQFQVLVDPDRLAAHSVTLEAVVRAAGDATAVAAGGLVDMPNQRLSIRHAASDTPADLARTVVQYTNGVPLRLGDVSDVVEGHAPPIGDAVINAGAGLLLSVEKQPAANTLEVTRNVEAALAALTPGLQGVDIASGIFRPATFIERALDNLVHAMLLGCALVAVILIAFLFDWRAALISLSAIPLALLAAAALLQLRGGTLNTLVIAGLVIAIGEVVDDAIIDVENIMRRLRLNRRAAQPAPVAQVVLEASVEVRSAVVFASLIVILVFVPAFFLHGLAGTFFRPLALSYVLAILASLAVALTVTPTLSLLMLPGTPDRPRDAPLVRALKRHYRAVLPQFVVRPRLAVAMLVAAFAATAVVLPGLGEEFLPDFKETDFLMHWIAKPGTSLDEVRRLAVRVSDELRAIPGVRNFGAHIGRAVAADEVVGSNFGEGWLSLDPAADYDATAARIQDVVAGYPGLIRDVLTYLKERINEVLSGDTAAAVVRIYGPDIGVLRERAEAVRSAIAGVPGVVDVHVEAQLSVPHVQVRLRPEAASNFGLTPGQVRRASATLINGMKVGEVYRDEQVVDVTVWGVERVRAELQALRALLIETPSGARVPLANVADVEIVPAPNEIAREHASRRIDVLYDVERGADLGSVARAIEARVAVLPFTPGYHPEFLGTYAARRSAVQRLWLLTALSMLGILVLLHVDFRSTRLMLLIVLTLPFALIGGVFAAWLAGGVLSVGSLVGFITVLGIAARNGIMLISHYRHLERVEGQPFGVRLALRGAEERLAPILMTASCAALALLPLVIRGNVPGQEIEYPMAVVILGGVATSTALNLFLMPALYAAYGRAR
ncbi:MAG: efflux RND transporter permease subunit [Candidatus Binatia bacterium]